MFRFSRNIETLCFGIEAKQTEKKRKKRKNRKNPEKLCVAQRLRKDLLIRDTFWRILLYQDPRTNYIITGGFIYTINYTITRYTPNKTVLVGLLFVSVQSKHRNSLFRYRSETTETNILFRIVPKLVSVPVSVVSNRNKFRRTPYP